MPKRKEVRDILSKIVDIAANEDYTLTIEFEQGSKLIFNMQNQIKILPYMRLRDVAFFKTAKFDDKSIYWEDAPDRPGIIPLRLSLDNILFSLRDC